MRHLRKWLAALALTLAGPAYGETTHTVAPGQTLGSIAKRYHLTIKTLCAANGIQRRNPIKPGQDLIIPSPEEAAELSEEPRTRVNNAQQVLELPGIAPIYYYEPSAPRGKMLPVLLYLHGRGGQPNKDCEKWAKIARPLGWLVCPSGPAEHAGGRAWENHWPAAQKASSAAVEALRKRYGRRVQLHGNTLIGFSEGAFAAMNLGLHEPRNFSRWLILAPNSHYWEAPGRDALFGVRDQVRRVYLITGELDEIADELPKVESWLRQAGVSTRAAAPRDLAHEVALERKPELYREALTWLDKGDAKKSGPKAPARGEQQLANAPAKTPATP